MKIGIPAKRAKIFLIFVRFAIYFFAQL